MMDVYRTINGRRYKRVLRADGTCRDCALFIRDGATVNCSATRDGLERGCMEDDPASYGSYFVWVLDEEEQDI